MKKLKKLLTLVLSAAMLLTAAPAAFAADGASAGFTDVASGAWYAQSVQYVSANGIMSGTSASTFSPENTMNRAMLATVLYRAAGSPAVTGAASSFSDVASDAYYAPAVAWASANGIVSGYGNGRFGSNDPVSRAQIAAIFWRYAGSPAAAAGQDFADESSIPSYAAQAVDWARANNVVSGKNGNIFDPQGNASRAQVAAILRNYLTMDNKEQQPEQPDNSKNGKVLVAYYSATGSTKAVAETLADELDADIFELTPVTPYTSADLNWTVDGSRVNREHEDESLRDVALTQNTPANWDQYDTVLIGYPIWWGIAAWPVNNFVKNNDFTGKTVIPFATSSSSGMGQSGDLLKAMAKGGDWQSGQRFSSGASSDTVRNWADSLNIGK